MRDIHPWYWLFFFFEFQLGVILSLLFILQWQNLQDFSYWQSGLGKSKFHIKLTSKYSVSHVSEFQYIESPNIFFLFWKRVKVYSEVRRHRKSATRDYDREKTNKQSKLFFSLCVNKAMEWIIASVELKSAHVILKSFILVFCPKETSGINSNRKRSFFIFYFCNKYLKKQESLQL
jgi:hypothetical protein